MSDDPRFPKHLLGLEKGWDSYEGNPPDAMAVVQAWTLGEILRPHLAVAPSYVPCSDGSVQVEWHGGGWDIEMVVRRHEAQEQTTEPDPGSYWPGEPVSEERGNNPERYG